MEPRLQRLVAVLATRTPFAENIIGRQCERLGFTPETLPAAALAQLLTNVVVVMRTYLEPTELPVFEARLRLALAHTDGADEP